MPDETDHTHVATNGRAEFSLDDLAELQGGLAPWMMLVSERARRCYHAAQAHNARLAKFQLSETIKLLRSSVKVRPQYAEAMDRFITDDLGALRKVLDAEDWAGFGEAWANMTGAVNDRHEEFDHDFLVWKVDPTPPGDLQLSPR